MTLTMGNNGPENLQHRCSIRNSQQGANPALQDVKWDTLQFNKIKKKQTKNHMHSANIDNWNSVLCQDFNSTEIIIKKHEWQQKPQVQAERHYKHYPQFVCRQSTNEAYCTL